MTRVLTLLVALAALACAPAARAEQPFAQLYASANGGAVLDVFAAGRDGSLERLGDPSPAGVRPAGVGLSPDGSSLYVANQLAGTVSQFDVARDGTPTPKAPATVPAGQAPFGLAVAPGGGHVYVTDQEAGAVSVFDVGADGALVPASTVAAGDGAVNVALSPDGSSAYVTNFAAHSISQYAVGADGSLAPRDPVELAAGAAPFAIALSPDGSSAYVTDQSGTGSVLQFDVTPDGTLVPKVPGGVPAGASPAGVVAGDDGVYVANFGANTVSQFDAGAGGALAPKAAPVAAGTSPWALALAPDGASLYASNYGGASISQYDVDAGGALAPKAQASVASSRRPVALAVRAAPDVTDPTVELTTPPEGATYDRDEVVLADFSCADEGPSALASCEGDVPAGDPIDTSTPGDHTFTVIARDRAGNETRVEHAYTVAGTSPDEPDLASWNGFAWPVRSLPAVNHAWAGDTETVRFRLTGADDADPADVLADGSPSSVRVNCRRPGAPDDGAPARSADGDGLTRDHDGTFRFTWATSERWSDTCRMLLVELRDGSLHRALYAFDR
jgi:YVTN family beta-propeller protein